MGAFEKEGSLIGVSCCKDCSCWVSLSIEITLSDVLEGLEIKDLGFGCGNLQPKLRGQGLGFNAQSLGFRAFRLGFRI